MKYYIITPDNADKHGIDTTTHRTECGCVVVNERELLFLEGFTGQGIGERAKAMEAQGPYTPAEVEAHIESHYKTPEQ